MLSNQNAFSPINCGCCTYSHLTSECYILGTGRLTFTHSHTHINTLMAKAPDANLLIRSDLGFSLLLKDTWTCSWGKRESNPKPSDYWTTRSAPLITAKGYFLNGEYLTFTRLTRLIICLNKVTCHSCKDYIGFWNLNKKLCLPIFSYVKLCDP